MSANSTIQSQIRHDFYQTDGTVVISVYRKGLHPGDVSVHFLPRSLRILVETQEIFALDPLMAEIDPKTSTYKVFGTKIELHISKITPGHWSELTSSVNSANVAPTPAVIPKAGSNDENITLPASTRKKKDWGKIADEEEEKEEASADSFLKKLYEDGNDEIKRAMMKSYSESGGTTLSTNWDDVGQRKVTGTPPDGMDKVNW